MFIQTEATPNPDTLKFLPGRQVMADGVREFATLEDAASSPLARALFEIDGVVRVYFGPDFLTVSKARDGVEWSHVKAPILAAVMEHFTSGQDLFAVGQTVTTGHDAGDYDGDTAQIVLEIKDLLDTRIRPAVAQDGGDILFNRFDPESGVVYLHMKGACAGCPSSTATLKAGVENMLKHYVPEVTGVEQTF